VVSHARVQLAQLRIHNTECRTAIDHTKRQCIFELTTSPNVAGTELKLFDPLRHAPRTPWFIPLSIPKHDWRRYALV
jgi:hypothetical protein